VGADIRRCQCADNRN